MKQDQSIRDAVRGILENAATAGNELPSIRAIRAKIGKGSFGTISEAVNEWKQEQLASRTDMPQGFDEQAMKKISDVVWTVVAPMMAERIGLIEQNAARRIEIEHAEANKVREAADEALATVEDKDNRIATLTEQVKGLGEALAKAQGALEQANAAYAALQAENGALHSALDKALQEAAKATAALESTQRLLPFLDPKHLDKVGMK